MSTYTNILSLKLYVRSCYSDTCTESARYPAPYHCDAAGNSDCSSPAPLVINGPVGESTKTRLLFRLDESADAWCVDFIQFYSTGTFRANPAHNLTCSLI